LAGIVDTSSTTATEVDYDGTIDVKIIVEKDLLQTAKRHNIRFVGPN